jgi:hypothetical protein
MAVCTSISLAITAHELSFTFAVSPLTTHILINIGGIDIYYLEPRRKPTQEERRKARRSKAHNVSLYFLFIMEPSFGDESAIIYQFLELSMQMAARMMLGAVVYRNEVVPFQQVLRSASSM